MTPARILGATLAGLPLLCALLLALHHAARNLTRRSR